MPAQIQGQGRSRLPSQGKSGLYDREGKILPISLDYCFTVNFGKLFIYSVGDKITQ